jgi:hypothetical protein
VTANREASRRSRPEQYLARNKTKPEEGQVDGTTAAREKEDKKSDPTTQRRKNGGPG